MSDDINKMDFKQLRNEVQSLRDELAIMKRKYEDIIYNLDTENFSSRFVKEQGDMKTAIKITAEGIETKVSKEDFESTIQQTAESISSIVSEFVDVSQAIEVTSPDEFTDKSKIYVIRTNDTETFYHYNTISGDWKPISADGIIYSLFEQREDGFYLKGDVKVDGSCILTDSLIFDSSDNPLQVEYSVDGVSNWHTSFASGSDKFMRLKIGAQWSDAMKVVGTDGEPGAPGTTANVTDGLLFEILTKDGAELGMFPFYSDATGKKLFINASYINSGTISAERIDTENLACTRIYAKDNPNGYYAKMVSSIGDFGIYKRGAGEYATPTDPNCVWGVYHSDPTTEIVNFYSYGHNYMGHRASDETIFAKGTWNFANCKDVLGLENFVSGGTGTVVAVFG